MKYLKKEVNRHTGGLEVREGEESNKDLVNRHAGGLEDDWNSSLEF